jgi:hypothetical protein
MLFLGRFMTKIGVRETYTPELYDASLGNLLDIAVRKGQENQTLGIPVGPDTSRILSDIVAVAIDVVVQDTLKLDSARAFRNVDDWYVGFDSAGDAENAIAALATSCRKFELELNAEKTRTLSAISGTDGLWPTELREHRFLSGGVEQNRNIEHFFNKAFHFAAQHPNVNVLEFAIKRTTSIRIHKIDWRLYESFLLKAARANATVIPTVVQILVSYNFNGYSLDQSRISKLIEDIIRKGALLSLHAEIAWALFLAKALRISLSINAARAVSSLDNSIVGLLALDLQQRGLVPRGLNTGLWRASMNGRGLHSHMWLLAYEADLKGWLRGAPADFVDKDLHFAVLKSKRISFYNEGRNVKHIRKIVPRRPSSAFLAFLRHIRSLGRPGAVAVTSIVRFS